jgi:hypothetical protein
MFLIAMDFLGRLVVPCHETVRVPFTSHREYFRDFVEHFEDAFVSFQWELIINIIWTILSGLAERAFEVPSDLSGVFDGPLTSVGGHLLEHTGLAGRFLTAKHEDWLP